MRKKSNCYILAMLLMALLTATSCNNRKFHIDGTISDAAYSMLYLEHMSLNGPVAIDSVKLDKTGTFNFSEQALDTITPDFYRLRIAGQIINISIDSTETVNVKASYPTMAYGYDVKGSQNCSKIKELALMQLNLQQQINAIVANPQTGADVMQQQINQALVAYKNTVTTNYIFKEPMKAYAYFALFQTVNVGGQSMLIFNPHASKSDVKVFAAVATSWDSFYPGAERGLNLHNIALEGMKDLRIVEAKQQQAVEASKIQQTGVLEVALPNSEGRICKLTDLKGKVVMLDFHVFASKQSMQRIMTLRDLYNKYHDKGFEIYQVSLDSDEHFWKTQTAALPWICVHDDNGMNSDYLQQYNIQQLPTFFLIDRNNVLQKRDSQISNLDAEIQSLLKQ